MEKIRNGNGEYNEDVEIEVIDLETEDSEGESAQQSALDEAPATPNSNIQYAMKIENDGVVIPTTGTGNQMETQATGMMGMDDLESGQMLSANDVNAIRIQIRQMGQAQLEEIVIKKIIEILDANTMLGLLKTKYLRLNGLTDRLFQKSNILLKQVADLSRAMKVYEYNETAKNPEDKKVNLPLKFFRSVGLQVNAASVPKIPPPQDYPIPSKRMRPMANSAELRNQVTQPMPNMGQPHSSRQMQPSNGNSGPINVNGNVGQATVNSGRPLMATVNTANGTSSTTGGLIDHTVGQGSLTFTTRHGDEYQVVNQNGFDQGAADAQLVSSRSGYHLVSPGGDILPVVFRQAWTNTRATHPPTQVQGQNQYRPEGRPIIIRPNQQAQAQQSRTGGSSTNYMPRGPLAQIAQPSGQSNTNFTMPQLPGPTISFQRQLQEQGLRVRGTKEIPPKPELVLLAKERGIALSWTHNMDTTKYTQIHCYQIFSCTQPLNSNDIESRPAWNKMGTIKALPLPMACIMAQFSGRNRYHFIVRGIDVYNRSGPFSEIMSIDLK